MDMRKWFFLSVIFLALVVGGCGGNGNGGGTAMMPGDDDDEPMACPAGQMRNADGDCAAPPPVVMPPSMALVDGIVTANDKDRSATDPAPYYDPKRPGKTGNGPNIMLKADGTFGDGMIGTTELEMSEDMMPPSVGSFANGAVFTSTKDDETNTVYVYETKDPPTQQAWDVRYAAGGDGLQGISSTTIDTENPVDTATNQKFTTLSFTGDVSDFAKRFASDMFPSAASQTNMYYAVTTYDAFTPQQKNEATRIRGQKFDGTFEGIPGEYSCAGTCTAQTDGQGYVSALTGEWMFTPADIADGRQGHMVQSVISDTDYLTFGYWVQEDDEDGEIGVGTFAMGSPFHADYTAAAFSFLEGTASYEGKAGGKFVQKTLTTDGKATVVDGGVFTADANLTARFGGNAISLNDKFSVHGTIDEFRNSDGDTIDSNWSVTLRPASFAVAGDAGKTQAQFEFSGGDTTAGGPTGKWGGKFVGTPMSGGSVLVPENGAEGANKDAYPTGVVGEFDAHFTNGHVLGAFGAELKK